jgi:Domain of unknown function (DUF4365)
MSDLPRRTRSSETDRIGVAKVQLFFTETRKWAFREQPVEDFGVDAQIEFAPQQHATGRLVAVQIKSGDSYLHSNAKDGWYFYPESKHVNYWTEHSLPVVVIFWHESTDELFMVEASPRTLERTAGKGWRLAVTKSDKLDNSRLTWLEALSDGNPYDLRIRELRLLLPLMHKIESGTRVVVQADEWINKSLNKRHLSIVEVADDETKTVLAEWAAFTGPGGYEAVFEAMFRWADLRMDPDVAWEAADYWGTEPEDDAPRPYANYAGEVDKWSLELTLGDLARAFLLVDEYARTGQQQLGITLK